MKVLSLFSGIGAFEKALDNLNIDYELVNYCEIDKYASKSYSLVHNVSEDKNLRDVTKVDTSKLPKDIDLITYGFPCQDISLAGKQKGLFNEDGSATRSGLFFEALRIIEDTKPKYAIAENVKNLVSKKFNAQFQIVLSSLEAAGYNNYWQVLNAKDYGIPQNRERVFIVSIRKDIDKGYTFPKPFELKLRLKDMLENEVDEKYYLQKTLNMRFTQNYIQYDNSGKGYNSQAARAYYLDSLCPTLPSRNNGDKSQIVEIAKNKIKSVFTETQSKMITPEGNVRRYINSEVVDEFNEGQCADISFPNGYNKGKRVFNECPTINGTTTASSFITKVEIPQVVRVRKYPVDTKKLVDVLRNQKELCDFSNKEIAKELNLPITKVEHWFRKDNSFAIPDENIWYELKQLLKIETDEFDESITTFEEREGVYEKSQRCYCEDGISPTITSSSADEKIITNLRIRKLTPKECWRLMGFDDNDFEKAAKVISNAQLYKQAGNSIVVNVLEHLLTNLYRSTEQESKKPMQMNLYNYTKDAI